MCVCICVCEGESCLKSVYTKILVRGININIDLYFTAKIPDIGKYTN